MEWNSIPDITLFSKGAIKTNPGIGGIGIILSFKGESQEFSQGYKLTTNNRLELMGVIYGLEQLETKSNVQIISNSEYVVNNISNGSAEKWKEDSWKLKPGGTKLVKNVDLWERLLNLTNEHNCIFIWIKSHAGNIENEKCDFLANQAIKSINLIDDLGYDSRALNKRWPNLAPNGKGPKANGKIQQVGDSFKARVKMPKVCDPSKSIVTLKEVRASSKLNVKSEQVGDPCRKCKTPLIRVDALKKPIPQEQPFYYEYYLFCPSCKRPFTVEAAKRNITFKSGKNRLR